MKLKAIVSGVFCSGLALAGILAVSASLPADRNAAEAAREEAMLFEDDNAQWFGEEPEIGTHLVLQGIERAETGEWATLSRDGSELRLAAGEQVVAPCLRLAAIYEDSVLLDDCSAYRLLSLSADADSYETQVPRAGQTPTALPDVIDYRNNDSAMALVRDYRDRLYGRPLSLRGRVEVDVREDAAGNRAYYIYPGDDKRLFGVLPLRQGDKITAVNGIRLSERQALTSLYEDLAQARHLAVTLQRGDKDMVLLLGL